jgi:hypothetical protein
MTHAPKRKKRAAPDSAILSGKAVLALKNKVISVGLGNAGGWPNPNIAQTPITRHRVLALGG